MGSPSRGAIRTIGRATIPATTAMRRPATRRDRGLAATSAPATATAANAPTFTFMRSMAARSMPTTTGGPAPPRRVEEGAGEDQAAEQERQERPGVERLGAAGHERLDDEQLPGERDQDAPA